MTVYLLLSLNERECENVCVLLFTCKLWRALFLVRPSRGWLNSRLLSVFSHSVPILGDEMWWVIRQNHDNFLTVPHKQTECLQAGWKRSDSLVRLRSPRSLQFTLNHRSLRLYHNTNLMLNADQGNNDSPEYKWFHPLTELFNYCVHFSFGRNAHIQTNML